MSRVCCWRTNHPGRADAAPGQGPTGAGGRAPGTRPLTASSGAQARPAGSWVSPWPRPAGEGSPGPAPGDKLSPGTQAPPTRHHGSPPRVGEGCCRLQVWTHETHTHSAPHGRSGLTQGSLTPDTPGAGGGPPSCASKPACRSLNSVFVSAATGAHRSPRGLEAPGGCTTAAAALPSPQ